MVDILLAKLRDRFSLLSDPRYKNKQRDLCSYLMSAFAMFHLKDPSLHHYRLNYAARSENLSQVYGIETLHSDSAMRKVIDSISPTELQEVFSDLLQMLEKEGIMDDYKILSDCHIIAFDGTEHYCNTTSTDKPCEHCLTREYRNKQGEVTKTTYHHQALAGVLVHPSHKEVFPVNAESI
jgi:hypothetical protein